MNLVRCISLVLVVCGCSAQPSWDPPAPVEETRDEAERKTASHPDAARSRRPPAGLYKLAVTTHATTCDDLGPSPEGPFFVQVRPRAGKQIASLPVDPTGRPARGRVDVPLEVGTVLRTNVKPSGRCGTDLDREIEVTEVSGGTIAILVRSAYAHTEGCPPPAGPSACKHEATMTYGLEEALCPADCAADVRIVPDVGVEKLGCRCGEAEP
jgi:hypothetical protein